MKTKNQKKGMTYLFIGLIVIGIAGVAIVLSARKSPLPDGPPGSAAVAENGLPGLQTGEAPWGAELGHLRERLVRIGLPALSEEGSGFHIHQYLALYLHGKETEVPAGIGFNPVERFISPLHTHDASGIIHIESPTVEKYTLGQFFDVWGVRLSRNCVGGYCDNPSDRLRLFVNGSEKEGDPRDLELTDHLVIILTYGTSGELPNPIPAGHTFPAGS